jgi:hypothetical protein
MPSFWLSLRHGALYAAIVTARKTLSLLVRAVIAGFGQAGHIEFDRIAAFVASGGKQTTNNAG